MSTWLRMLKLLVICILIYRIADKSLARPERKQANVSVRMAWISFGALPCRKKKTWWQLASRCCWNRARPWHAAELVSFLVGLRTYKHPGTCIFDIYLYWLCLHTDNKQLHNVLDMLYIYIYIYIYILQQYFNMKIFYKYFYAHPVNNIGSHNI